MIPVTQEEFEKLLEKLQEEKKKLAKGQKLSLANFLQKHGFTSDLKDINFAVHDKTVTEIAATNSDQTIVSDTKIPYRSSLLRDLDFTGCTMKHCTFDKCDLSGSVFNEISIEASSFNQTVMNNMTIKNTRFHSGEDGRYCTFDGASFDYSSLENVNFEQCIISRATFNYLQQLNAIDFEDNTMTSTSIIGGCQANNVTIRASGEGKAEIKGLVTDKIIKYEHIEPKKDNPSILISWNNKEPGVFAAITEKMLLAKHLNPIRMDYNPPVNEIALNDEVDELNQLTTQKMEELRGTVLEKAKKIAAAKDEAEREHLLALEYQQSKPLYLYHAISSLVSQLLSKKISDPKKILDTFDEVWKKDGIGFPMLMIEILREKHAEDPQNFPEMTALYEHAKKMFDQVDGIIIPGGQDIDPRFYGQLPHPKTKRTSYAQQSDLSDVRRDVLEFSLVYMQQRAGAPKPLAAICRGSQVVASAYGGKIYQDINAKDRASFHVEPIVPKKEIGGTPLLSTKKRMTLASDTVVSDKLTLAAMFQHHQGYDLMTAHGLVATASTETSSGVAIDVVAENLPQNITISQAHLEFAYDENEARQQTESGLAAHISERLTESIFGQFDMRVRAYANNKQITSQLLRGAIEKQGRIFLTRSENEDLTAPAILPPKTGDYNSIIIGMGPVGLLAAISAINRGEDVLLVTDRDSKTGLTVRQQVLGIDDEAMQFIWTLVRPELKEKYIKNNIVTLEEYETVDPQDPKKKVIQNYWYFSTGGLEKMLLEELNARIDERCMHVANTPDLDAARKEARGKVGIDEVLVDKIDPKLLEEIDLSSEASAAGDSAHKLRYLRNQTLLRKNHIDIRPTEKTLTLSGIKEINSTPVDLRKKSQTFGYEHVAIANGGKQAAERSLAGLLHGENVHLDAPLVESHVAVIFHLKGTIDSKPPKAFDARELAGQIAHAKKHPEVLDPVKMDVLRQYGWADASRPHHQIYASRTNDLTNDFCYIGCEYPNAIKAPAIQAAMELKVKNLEQYQKSVPLAIRKVIDKSPPTTRASEISKKLAREWSRLLFRDAISKEYCDNNLADPVYSATPSPIERGQIALETSQFDLAFSELANTILISGDPLIQDVGTIVPLGDGRMSPLYTTGTGFQTGTKMAMHYHHAQSQFNEKMRELLLKHQKLQKVKTVEEVNQENQEYRKEYAAIVKEVYQELHANIRKEVDKIREVQENWIANRNARVIKAERVLFVMEQALNIETRVNKVSVACDAIKGANKEVATPGGFFTPQAKNFLDAVQDPGLAQKLEKIKQYLDKVAYDLHQIYGRFTEDQIVAYEKLPGQVIGKSDATVQEYYASLRQACLSIKELQKEIEDCASFCEFAQDSSKMSSSVYSKLKAATTEMQELLNCQIFRTHTSENELNIDASDPFIKEHILQHRAARMENLEKQMSTNM